MSAKTLNVSHMTHVALELSTQEAADILGVGRRTIHRWAQDGTLPVARKKPGELGAYVFLPRDVEALAAKRRADLEARLARLNGAAS